MTGLIGIEDKGICVATGEENPFEVRLLEIREFARALCGGSQGHFIARQRNSL